MSITATCTHCKQSVQAPDQLAGSRFRCPKCTKVFLLPSAAVLAATAADVRAKTPVAQTAFWLGIAALGCGGVALLATPFYGAAGFARAISWLGLLLGAGAAGMAFFRDECDYPLPLAGFSASALSLAVVIFLVGASPFPGGWAPGTTAARVRDRDRDPNKEGNKDDPNAADRKPG